jgi:pimeloyl-ACP methyl ester carboxylesterase
MKKYLLLLAVAFLWSCQTPTPSSTATERAEALPIIRINDDGSLANEKKVDGYCTEVAKAPQTVVVFIHGWHGSASPPDRNIRAFLDDLKMVRTRTYEKSGRKLTGIAVEWKARTWPSLLEYPGYYRTRARADKIAKGDGIARSLKKLAHSMRRRSGEHLIVAGHSMGARILGRVVRKNPELMKDMDLVLLANTADGAYSCSRTLDQVNAHPYRLGRLPKLVWVTSAHDIFTRIVYPIFDAELPPGHTRRLIDYDVKIDKT